MSASLVLEAVSVVRAHRPVLHAVSLALHPGEVVCLIGPNGSGKSSLAMAACALVPLASGRVLLDGEAIGDLDPRSRAQRIAYVPQRSELSSALSVAQVVAMGRFAHGRGWGATPGLSEAVAQALRDVDALDLAARPFTELSGGELQRVLIARALATGAGTLVLDEPSSALDVAHRLAVLQLVRALARAGKAVLVALHDLSEAAGLADRVVLLQAGRIVAEGPPDAVITPQQVRATYGVTLIPGGGFGYGPAS